MKNKTKFWLIREKEGELYLVIGKHRPQRSVYGFHKTWIKSSESGNFIVEIDRNLFPDVNFGNPCPVECEIVPKYLITNRNISHHIHNQF